MRSILLVITLLAAAPAWVCAQSVPNGQAQILDGPRCSATIGSGGNLKLPSGETLQGKCEGAGTTPVLTEGGRVIEFTIRSDRSTEKDRTELAFTEKKSRFQFGRLYAVSFDVEMPPSGVTNDFFYVAQFWQSPTKPPIAGVRVQRGLSGKATVMARGDGSPPEGKSIAEVDLRPDAWVSVAIRIKVAPGDGSCIEATIDGVAAPRWCGSIGYADDKDAMPWYRFKFGIYKGSEPGKQFRVRFRNISIRAID